MGVKPELAQRPGETSEAQRRDAIEYAGNCVNRTTGDYKGWPMDDGERRAIFG